MKPTIFQIVTNGTPVHATKGHKAGIRIRVSEKYEQYAEAYYEPGEPIARVLGWHYEDYYFFVCKNNKKGDPEIALILVDPDQEQNFFLQEPYEGNTLQQLIEKMQETLRYRIFDFENEQEFGIVNEEKTQFYVYSTTFQCIAGQNGRLIRAVISQLMNTSASSRIFYNRRKTYNIIGKDSAGADHYIMSSLDVEGWLDTETWRGYLYEGHILFPMRGQNKLLISRFGLQVWQAPYENLFWVEHPGAAQAPLTEGEYPVQGYECNPVSAALTDYREVIEQAYSKLLGCVQIGNSRRNSPRNRRRNLPEMVYTGGPVTLTPRHSRLAGNCAAGTYRFMLKWRKNLPISDLENVTWENFPVPLDQKFTLAPSEIRIMVKSDRYFAKLISAGEKGYSYTRQAAKAVMRRARRKGNKVLCAS